MSIRRLLNNRRTLAAAVLLPLLLLFVSSSYAQTFRGEKPPIPHLTSPVYDETGTLSEGEKSALEQKLLRYEDSTSTQIVVVIVATTNDFPASDYAVAVAQENKVGQSQKNNGALLLVAKNDRKMFIATGYGLEPTLTDAVASQIVRQILQPSFRAGDFYGGIDSATTAIMLAAKGEFKADTKPVRGRGQPNAVGLLIIVGGFLLVILVLGGIAGSGARRTVVGAKGSKSGLLGGILQALFWTSILSSGGSRRRGPWDGSGGGGFGGGGFGGGGGWSGGGGGFGGGGAGGSW